MRVAAPIPVTICYSFLFAIVRTLITDKPLSTYSIPASYASFSLGTEPLPKQLINAHLSPLPMPVAKILSR